MWGELYKSKQKYKIWHFTPLGFSDLWECGSWIGRKHKCIKIRQKGLCYFCVFTYFPKFMRNFTPWSLSVLWECWTALIMNRYAPTRVQKKRIMHFLFFIFIFLGIREDQRNETSHLWVSKFYENLKWFGSWIGVRQNAQKKQRNKNGIRLLAFVTNTRKGLVGFQLAQDGWIC